ncbi:hypothetical protein ASG87_10055 [Frateuria sp. Soil773]|uniref:hypothetical protein n=1 Tax=Frateuria sp. Soil773 TaxID=1736407 RepID=UPI0006F1D114|nr:hypothetical protein [Frateuria sp. Soil773]KRF01844.1 hypothetical protein ASG87_10055 [Frateuria sp. Soil773]
MIELIVVVSLFGALWLAASLIGVVFKLTFALIGGLFGMVAGAVGLVFGGIALLVVAPLVAIALLPLCLPVLLLAALVWAIVRANKRAPASTGSCAH